MAYVITDECIACGACEDECPVVAVSCREDEYVIDADLCTDCGACVDVCPVEAIVPGDDKKKIMSEKKKERKMIKVPLKPIRRGYGDFIFPYEYVDEEEYKRGKEANYKLGAIIGRVARRILVGKAMNLLRVRGGLTKKIGELTKYS